MVDIFLICQDSEKLTALAQTLTSAGLTVFPAIGVTEGLAWWVKLPARTMVAAFPTDTNITSIHKLRTLVNAPILVLSDTYDEEEYIAALNAGADVVLHRPCSGLLISQIQALLRRTPLVPPLSSSGDASTEIKLDRKTGLVQVRENCPRHLSRLEYRLLDTLMQHRGQVLSIDDLVEHVWGYTGEGNRDLVRKLVRRLRLRVEPTPDSPTYIISVPGFGYRFNE